MTRSEAKETFQMPTPDLRATPVLASGLVFLHQTILALSSVTNNPERQDTL